ncbi:xylulokinase [Anaerobium acetethylicum]|uniref:Xylulokinase n=1 Tax=Anaerobium acetethylicum TaxID=1619234 RepID=A0A1D3TWF4_9FIRM|nr:FGGY-family carbohydrate kinase [Anaerobium acetethylicum]SCP98541.1 xylulokinase [Anaerobium acetethylicum]
MRNIENYLLGIDLGTTNVKAIIMDEHGTVVSSASRANSLIFPGPGMVEQDPGAWWEHTAEILRAVTEQAGPEIVRKIRGISISSQTVTMLPLDREGNPLRNALIWMDARSAGELQYIIDTIGFDRYVSIIGAQPDVAFLPNKILWFKKNEPELFAKTYRIMQASSYLNFKLTGQMTMDIDQAARCQCLDINTLKWSDEISDVIGVDLNSILPQPKAVHEIIGSVTASAAAETGLVSGIPVVAGASDAMASMYATGLSQIGEAGESSGTTSLVFVGHDKPSQSDLPVVTKPCSITGMPYIFDAPINTSGASIKWYLDTFGKAEQDYAALHNINVYEHLNQLAAESEPGSGGLIYFPYLLGERAPLWNSHAKGMFIGLSLDTERKDIIRSVFEGTAFALRHVMTTIKDTGAKADCLRITGGGSKSRVWCQIKASMLRMPVYILDEKSGDVPFGDTLIAGHAVGVFPDLTETISKLIQVKEIIQPVEEWADVYDQMYPLYIDMYQHLDSDLIKLKETMAHIQK